MYIHSVVIRPDIQAERVLWITIRWCQTSDDTSGNVPICDLIKGKSVETGALLVMNCQLLAFPNDLCHRNTLEIVKYLLCKRPLTQATDVGKYAVSRRSIIKNYNPGWIILHCQNDDSRCHKLSSEFESNAQQPITDPRCISDCTTTRFVLHCHLRVYL